MWRWPRDTGDMSRPAGRALLPMLLKTESPAAPARFPGLTMASWNGSIPRRLFRYSGLQKGQPPNVSRNVLEAGRLVRSDAGKANLTSPRGRSSRSLARLEGQRDDRIVHCGLSCAPHHGKDITSAGSCQVSLRRHQGPVKVAIRLQEKPSCGDSHRHDGPHEGVFVRLKPAFGRSQNCTRTARTVTSDFDRALGL